MTSKKRLCLGCKIPLTLENGYIQKTRNRFQSYCRVCLNKKTLEKGQRNKQRAIEYKGGKCAYCGYNRCSDALEFHHIDSRQKDKMFRNLRYWGWERTKKELEKCLLLCSNCHREKHSDM